MKRALRCLAWIVVGAAQTACDRGPRFRQYIEEVQAAPESATAPVASASLKWTTPAGWVERPGGGMRLAAFGVGEAECTVISFPGAAGGLEGNLTRWLGQLGLEASPERLAALAESSEQLTTEAGAALQLFDFRTVTADTAATNMLAATLPLGGQTIFVKLMGPPSLLEQQKDAFRALCRSLSLP